MQKKSKLITFLSIGILTIILTVITIIYVNDFYKYIPDKESELVYLADDTLVFEAANSNIGLIFYPGGKVEYKAYIPLMEELQAKGVTCLLVDMPFNLAVLDVNRANGLQEKFSNVTSWYLCGHSLGGSMAATYLSNNLEDYIGLILLGSYSTVDFSNTDIKVLSIFGENDKVMNKEKYLKYKNNIDDNLVEVIIEGGNHAYFGMYGDQSGDGEATITVRDQINKTTNIILEFIG